MAECISSVAENLWYVVDKRLASLLARAWSDGINIYTGEIVRACQLGLLYSMAWTFLDLHVIFDDKTKRF